MVALPVTDSSSHPLRLYRRAMSLWCCHVSDEMAFGSAAAFANARLPDIPEANCIFGFAEPSVVADIQSYFATANVHPLAWYFPESEAAGGQEGAAAGADRSVSLKPVSLTLLELTSTPALPQTHPALTIIPARASFRHVQQIAADMRPGAPAQQCADAIMSHLDDPHLDAVLALHAGEPVAYASVLSTGDAGLITDLFVQPGLRSRGYGKTMAGHILDICRRSLFKHVLAAVPSADQSALAFAGRIGLAPVAETTLYEYATSGRA